MLLSSSPVHKCLKKKLKKNHACLLKFILCDLGRLGGNNFHGPDFLIELLNFYVLSFYHIGSGISEVEEASRILDQIW